MAETEMSSEKKTNKAVRGLIVLVVLGLLGFVGVEFTSSPTFCKMACHSMVLEASQWEKSNHAKNGVECMNCHVGPGLLGLIDAKMAAMPQMIHEILGTIGEPYVVEEEEDYAPQYIHNPKVDDGIHSSYADAKGNYIIRVKPGGHAYEVLNQNCRDCHSHKGSRGMKSKYQVADFVVRNTLISFRGIKEKRRKGVAIPHAVHLDKGHYCTGCHAEVVHGADEYRDANNAILPRMEICFRCHNDEIAPRRCPMCHEKQKEMNYGTGGRGVENEASVMVQAEVQCNDCHQEENDYKILPKVCEGCHEEGQIKYKEEWQREMKELLAALGKRLDEVRVRLPKGKEEEVGGEMREAVEMYNVALENYEFIIADGSKSAHNPDYARKLIEVSNDRLNGLRTILGL